jgi:hypothetical protein
MIKPLSIKRQEFIENLVNLVNTSDLPPCVMESIIGNVHSSVQKLVSETYKKEKEIYETFLKAEERKEEQ